ncbi:acyl carrier protein [Actinomadura barringtoniae]|uniref:Acyl carrier protein n=1 Tax=Actinomadura barringtoniae TaxID=1427535 RepID=A0A939PAI4_9ACTN|nr:acyl carrier protein [Actinomadura barringtoniae]MBO2448577.1 acyl carrier protein [Actinomadura barringtoniae]
MIKKKLRNKLPDGVELNADTEIDRLGLSSLQIADIVFSLEDKYDFEFDLNQALGITTISGIVEVANEALSEYSA